jgi:hypothetical protein
MVEVVQLALQEAHGMAARAPAGGFLPKPPFDEQELAFLLRFYGEPLSEFHWEGYPILATIAGLHQSKATKKLWCITSELHCHQILPTWQST